jgi:hypothetical protein
MQPNHVFHIRLMATLCLVLDAQLRSSNQHNNVHAKTAWACLLDDLSERRSVLVLEYSGCGNAGILWQFEQPQQFDLLQSRKTHNVQRPVAQQHTRQRPTAQDARGCRPS